MNPVPRPPPRSTRLRPPAEVTIQNPCQYADVGARLLRPWIEALVRELNPAPASLVVRFVSDREMRRLNRTYRDRDAPTDVLSFPGGRDVEGLHLGDVVISVPAARRQADERRHAVEREIKVLLLHGLLHCLGHDHETDDGTMVRLERRLRRRWVDRG